MSDAEKTETQLVAALTAARQQQGLTYEDVAARAGLHRTAVSLIERGERHMTLAVFLKLCGALHLNPAELFGAKLVTPKPLGVGGRPMPTLSTPARHAPTLHEAARELKDDRKKK